MKKLLVDLENLTISMSRQERYFLLLVCDGTVSPLAPEVVKPALVPCELRHLFKNESRVLVKVDAKGRLGRLARYVLFKMGQGLKDVIVRPSRKKVDSSFWDLDTVILVLVS